MSKLFFVLMCIAVNILLAAFMLPTEPLLALIVMTMIGYLGIDIAISMRSVKKK